MIVYQQAFDLYHTVFRMIMILSRFTVDDEIEIDKLRIWDYFLLFPNKMSKIRLRKDEEDVRKLIKIYIDKSENPYEDIKDDRKMFEKMKPYQLSAIKCIASYGIIDKDYLTLNRIIIKSNSKLSNFKNSLPTLSVQEENALRLLTKHFDMSLFGEYGLKSRTNLLESKYDA